MNMAPSNVVLFAAECSGNVVLFAAGREIWPLVMLCCLLQEEKYGPL